MGDVINQSTIWKFVGLVSAITGLVCFPHGLPYRMSLGKLGYGGHLVYVFVCSFMWYLMMLDKRSQVPEKFKGVVEAILFVVLLSISLVYDKYGPGKSDAYTITSYGSFALMSASLSRKLELGFETGFSAFFLQLFAAQLFKIKWLLLPIALVFCFLVIILRHYSESRVVDTVNEESTHHTEPGVDPEHRLQLAANEEQNLRLNNDSRLMDELMLWNFVGDVLAINGLVCFPQGSLYLMSFGKLGYGGLLVYLLVCLFMWSLMLVVRAWARTHPGQLQVVLEVVPLHAVICLISVAYNKDAYTVTSYFSFALLSLFLERKLDLALETGFPASFLHLSAPQLYQIKGSLIALVFRCLILPLRVVSEIGFIQYFQRMRTSLSEQSPTTNNQENNQEESSWAMDRSPSNGQAPEGSTISVDSGNQQNRAAEGSCNQGQVSSEPRSS